MHVCHEAGKQKWPKRFFRRVVAATVVVVYMKNKAPANRCGEMTALHGTKYLRARHCICGHDTCCMKYTTYHSTAGSLFIDRFYVVILKTKAIQSVYASHLRYIYEYAH